jgi:2-dehydropantoate 2-reductase
LLPLKTVQGRSFPGSSSWQSLARGASVTEVDYLTGEIVLLGRLHGIPTLLNETLQAEVQRMARDRLPPGSLDPELMRFRLRDTRPRPRA